MKKNVLIIILTILVLGLGAFVGYDKFIKEESKCITKCDVKTNEKTSNDNIKVNTDNLNTSEQTEVKDVQSTSKTADERYKDYIANLTKTVEQIHNYQQITYKNIRGDKFDLRLTSDKRLALYYHTKDDISGSNELVANDVVSFFLAKQGSNDDENTRIYFVKTDGSLYSTELELSVKKGSYEIRKEHFNNIVEVRTETGPTGSGAIYIDIDGNHFSKS